MDEGVLISHFIKKLKFIYIPYYADNMSFLLPILLLEVGSMNPRLYYIITNTGLNKASTPGMEEKKMLWMVLR